MLIFKCKSLRIIRGHPFGKVVTVHDYAEIHSLSFVALNGKVIACLLYHCIIEAHKIEIDIDLAPIDAFVHPDCPYRASVRNVSHISNSFTDGIALELLYPGVSVLLHLQLNA